MAAVFREIRHRLPSLLMPVMATLAKELVPALLLVPVLLPVAILHDCRRPAPQQQQQQWQERHSWLPPQL